MLAIYIYICYTCSSIRSRKEEYGDLLFTFCYDNAMTFYKIKGGMVLAGVADRVFKLIKETVEGQNVILWDVKFVKEGASYYLRVFIDSDAGINIDDCTNVSHAIDPIIDEADPIDKSYYLEVCSPGLERELARPEHFEKFIGSSVKVKLYRAFDGKKEVIGELFGFDGGIQLKIGDKEIYFEKKDFSSVRLNDLD